ncbi:MAG: beta-N-acetylhexosaminidase [Pseudomonadota bacterium]
MGCTSAGVPFVHGAMKDIVGQSMWIGFDGLVLPSEVRALFAGGAAGAAVLFGRNISSVDQLLALNAAIHAAAPPGLPVTVCVDEEGGRAQRARALATAWPPMLRLGDRAARSPREAAEAARLSFAVGRAIGLELAALGFDLDFAPVLDVNSNPANPVIGDRSFARHPEQVVALAGAFAEGIDDTGILPCGKHFPGHGDTTLDSHLALPRVDHPLARLQAIELAPFRAHLHLPVMMTAHVVFAALDEAVPATLSKKVLDILRDDWEYDGVLVSDDLEMRAIADNFGVEEAAERAIMAGCDALLFCHSQEKQLQAFEALTRRAEQSSALRDRLNQSCERVVRLKRRSLAAASKPRPDLLVVGCLAHRVLAQTLAGSPE